MKKYKKLFKWIVWSLSCTLASVITIFFAVQIYIKQSTKEYLISDPVHAPTCDFIMVLGAQVYSNGTPSPVLEDRLDYAYELYSQGKAPKILVSGDHGRRGYDEVNSMRQYLIHKGVPIDNIFMDHAGFNTYDSMCRASEIFDIKTLLICTQEFHISRSIYLAHASGIEAYGYPCEDKEIYNMVSLNVRECFARVKAMWDVTIKRSPKYLGEVIPTSGSGKATEG
jgi:SanA protein